jgi:hypothetical protein
MQALDSLWELAEVRCVFYRQVNRPGPLSQIETWMLEFHNLLGTRIPEVRLPSAPARFA